MENYKVKLRKGIGGFPTRCVGCLLALIVLFNSFTAYALNYSNDSYPIDISNVPPMTEMYTLSKQLSHNIWFGYSPTNQLYYYISWEDIVPVPTVSLEQTNFIFNNDSASSQFNTLTFWAHWNNTPMGNTNGFYYVYDVNGIQWQEMTISIFEDIYGQQSRNISLPSDFVLLACEMNTPIYDSNDNLRFRYRGNFNRSYMNGATSWNSMQYYTFDNVTTKYYFNSTGTIISNGEPGSPDGEVTNSGIKGWFEKLKLWLENLGSSISNAIANIQGWLSSLGSIIGGFFSDLWNNHLSVAFSNVVNWIKAPFQEGGIIYNLWNGLKDFFIDVGDWFLEIPDNIKALFIPDEDFFTDYKADVEDAMEEHFGAVYQTVELSQDLLESVTDLFDYEDVDDVQLFFPRLRLDLRVLGIQEGGSRFATLTSTNVFWLSDYLPGAFEPLTYQFLNNYSKKFYPLDVWYAFVTATLFIYLIYYLKNQLNRILSGSFNIGDE